MAHNGSVHDIERSISGQPAKVRRAIRQEQSKPKVEAFRSWAEQHLTRIPGKSDLARAFRYGLGRWPSTASHVRHWSEDNGERRPSVPCDPLESEGKTGSSQAPRPVPKPSRAP